MTRLYPNDTLIVIDNPSRKGHQNLIGVYFYVEKFRSHRLVFIDGEIDDQPNGYSLETINQPGSIQTYRCSPLGAILRGFSVKDRTRLRTYYVQVVSYD